jgi:hypothetical protein
VEPERPSSDESDLRVERLDESVVETGLDCRNNRRSMFAYSFGEANEGSNAAPLRPGHPSVECDDGTGSRSGDRNAQAFF